MLEKLSLLVNFGTVSSSAGQAELRTKLEDFLSAFATAHGMKIITQRESGDQCSAAGNSAVTDVWGTAPAE